MGLWFRLRVALIAPTLMLLDGCAVTLLSSYDQQTETLVSDIQKRVAGHLDGLKGGTKPDCFYQAHESFYRSLRLDLHALELRTQAIPKNQPTIEQVKALIGTVDGLDQLHRYDTDTKKACLDDVQLVPIERAFDSEFLAIMRLEIAKKRGKE